MFVHKLLLGLVDSESHLSYIDLNDPTRFILSFRYLRLPLCRFIYAQHEPFRALCSNYNSLYNILSLYPCRGYNDISQKFATQ